MDVNVDLHVGVEYLSDITLASIGGEIDIVTEPAFTQALATHLGDGATEVWLDLTEVRFISAHGYRILRQALSDAHNHGVDVQLEPSRSINRITTAMAGLAVGESAA